MPARPLKRREKRVIAFAATVAVAAMVFQFGVRGFYRDWMNREAEISAATDTLAGLHTLIREQEMLSRAVRNRDSTAGLTGQLVSARTSSLAASELQRVIRMYAERSRITIDRLEFPGGADPGGTETAIVPLTISGVGDIYGITDFLTALQKRSPVLQTGEISLIANSALKAGLIQFSLSLQAPVIIE